MLTQDSETGVWVPSGAAPAAAQLDADLPDMRKLWSEAESDPTFIREVAAGSAEVARVLAGKSAQLDADYLPPPAIGTGGCFPNFADAAHEPYYTAGQVHQIVAQHVERIRLLEREQLPKLADDDEVTFPNDTGLAVIRTERYYQLREAEERIALLERELAGRANSPVIPDGCGRCPRDTPYGPATCGKCIEAEERAQQPAQSIDTPEFRALADKWAGKMHGSLVGDHEPAWAALIACIDGRTAGTAWISVDAQMPRSGQRVIFGWVNSLGKWRTSVGNWNARFTQEATNIDEEACEYNEADDNHYLLEGWNEWGWELEFSAYVTDRVTHWMPLPAAPSTQENAK